MNEPLILGLVSIISGSMLGGFGLFLTARSRSAPMRQLLYEKQLELAIELSSVLDLLLILGRRDVEGGWRADSLDPGDIRDLYYKQLARLSSTNGRANAILPTDLVFASHRFEQAAQGLAMSIDQGPEEFTYEHLEYFVAEYTTTLRLTRSFLGIDALSKKSLSLFTSPDDLKRLGHAPGVEPAFDSRQSAELFRTMVAMRDALPK